MTDHDFRSTKGGDAPDVDALERFVIDTARDDAPPQGAKARLLDSAALTFPLSGASRSRGSIVRALSGRGIYAVGIALLASGATVAFARFTHEPPAAPVSHAPALPAAAPAHEPSAPSTPIASLPVAEAPPVTKSLPTRGVASVRALTEHGGIARAPSTERAAPSTPEKTTPSPPAGEAMSTLDREIAHMSTVRAALARGDAPRALELLDAYDTEFPSGAFRTDVSVLRIEALARSGRTAEARDLGERFLAKHPQSASARRVTLTLGGLAPPNQDAAAASTTRP